MKRCSYLRNSKRLLGSRLFVIFQTAKVPMPMHRAQGVRLVSVDLGGPTRQQSAFCLAVYRSVHFALTLN